MHTTIVADCLLEWFPGCLKDYFKEFSTIGNRHTSFGEQYEYPNCTMPWHQSMLGKFNNYDTQTRSCNREEHTSLYTLDGEFMLRATRKNVSKCPGS